MGAPLILKPLDSLVIINLGPYLRPSHISNFEQFEKSYENQHELTCAHRDFSIPIGASNGAQNRPILAPIWTPFWRGIWAQITCMAVWGLNVTMGFWAYLGTPI